MLTKHLYYAIVRIRNAQCERTCKTSSVDIEKGSVTLCGDLSGAVTAKCREGYLNFRLSGGVTDYNYTLGITTGNINIGSSSYHGRTYQNVIDNNAENTMELTCNKGEIAVVFSR